MEKALVYNTIGISCAIALVLCAWRVVNWVWLRPKKLEKCLREQGLKGNSYKVLFGDMKMVTTLIKEAKSKPTDLSHDVVPRVMPWVHESIKNHGNNFFLWFGTTPRVHIMDPELMKDVLNKYQNFQKLKPNPLVKLLSNGLASHEGEQWAKHRKIINPAFHLERLKFMLPAFYSSCSEMMSKWEKMVSVNGSSELDVWPYLETLTSYIISRMAFDSSYEEGRRIFQLQEEQIKLAVQAALSIYIPGLWYFPTKRNKRMKEIDKEVHVSLRRIVEKKIDAMKNGETRNDDLLGILLESNFKEVQEQGNKSSGMSITEVMEECKVFYFAGHETASSLLVWTMILLSMHPNWQIRAREEVLQVFGNDKPDFDGLSRLKVVTMILYEVLRLYPPIVALSRTVNKETTLGDISLPQGVQVTMPIMLIHRDYDLWGDDANEFKPERFSEGVSKAAKNHVSFFPFGWGPRICIGQNFAMLEAKMTMVMILQRFSFELSSSYVHAPSTVMTLQPQHGAQIILHKL
ncbi:hypothetical protein LguiB_002027 [Lonicera macranthoides]